MKWEYSHRDESTPGVVQLSWEEWNSGPYKIVTYDHPGIYHAYYHSQHVCDPPDIMTCEGCGSAHCNGYHKVWKSLDRAQQDCEDHATRMRVEQYNEELPW